MNNASLPIPDFGSMVARLAEQVDSFTQEIAVLRSLQTQSTESSDPTLIRQNDSFAFQPSEQLLEVGTYYRNNDGASKYTFLESLLLSPLSADEKKAVAASSHSMLGVDYSPPKFQKASPSKAIRDYEIPSFGTSSIKRARQSNGSITICTRRHRPSPTAPPISPASAPQLIDPAVMRDTLATAEATKKNWTASQPETKSNSSRTNKKPRRGRKPASTKPPAEQDDSGSQPDQSRPKSSAPQSDTPKSEKKGFSRPSSKIREKSS
ncbi:hypothetical protein BGX23_003254, partial [Mortierella sp. AD031]